ncbi:MAG: MotA/TolQ/ExbB proton channel family protein [Myxococcales bacterium]|nr:MotA/TolQ/ExbB proton channel family protein [Myxococcales bacterium]
MVGIIVVVLSGLVSAFLPEGILPEFVREPFHAGGLGMRLILFSLIVSLWLMIDRAVALMRASFDTRTFTESVRAALQQGNVQGALAMCQQADRPLSRIIAAGLAKSDQGEHEVQAGMDEAAYGELPQLEKRTGFLALMGNVATLMGLFGTIIGLIHSFGVVGQSQDVSDKATKLAAGISEAMNCTAFGLFTGIVALVAFSILNGKTQRLIDQINHLSLRVYRSWKTARGAENTSAKPVGAPHAHLQSTGLLKHGAGGHGGKKSTFANLQLTPLIDMFIVMVIFLLMSFSASGAITAVQRDVKLPFAEKVAKLQRALVLAISYPEGDPTGGVVTLEGSEVSTAKDLLDDSGPDWKISKLTEQLQIHKNNWKVTHPNESFPGELIMLVDQNVNFKIIKKVMYSAGVAGYTNLLFAVTKKASSEGGGGGGGGH